jgi:Fe2+ transport system protein FeoA
MILSVDRAPLEVPLTLAEIRDETLSDRLARMGVYPGDELVLVDDDVAFGPVRVRGPKGEVVLGGGVAAKVIVHHDDGHKTPVTEMHPGETGHVEGLVCGSAMARGLEILGIGEDDAIEMIRRVPAMDYQVAVGKQRVRITEGAASKIWGEMGGQPMQFVMVGRGKPFLVLDILGGRRARATLERLGIVPGQTIVLEAVTPADSVGASDHGRIVLCVKSGLRLHLRPDQAQKVLVVPRLEKPAG